MQFNYGGVGFANRVKPIPMPLPPDEIAYFADSYSGDTRMLFTQLYLFGQRISEALATKRGDITIEDNGSIMVLNSITEKNKQMPFRVLPARINSQLAKEFAEWVADRPAGRLYKFTRHTAYQSLRKRGGATFPVMALVPHSGDTQKKQWAIEQITYTMHPHYLRHCCLTHKVLYSHYDLFKLMTFAGWSTPAPAMIYIQLNWRDLLGGKT